MDDIPITPRLTKINDIAHSRGPQTPFIKHHTEKLQKAKTWHELLVQCDDVTRTLQDSGCYRNVQIEIKAKDEGKEARVR
jgi:hypothetical protein